MGLSQDLRFALRQLRQNLGFTCTAVVVLGLGLCAAASIFGFADAALLKPLPYRDPARLVGVFESIPIFPRSNLSYLDYLDWKKLNQSFTSLDVYRRIGYVLTTPGGPQVVRGGRVSAGFFRTLGVAPALGRDFYEGEDVPGKPLTVMLSYSAWQQRYGGRPDALGQSVVLDGEANVIVGVLPAGFHFAPAGPAEFWTALHVTGGCDFRRSCHGLYGVARLKDGVTIQAALDNVKAIAKQLEQQYPDSNRDQGAALAPLAEVIVGDMRPLLLVLVTGAGLLLLIAGANVASLLLVRAESRRREIAVRTSLGASPGRIVRQFVTEGLLLVGAGTALGLAGVSPVTRVMTSLIPANLLGNLPFWQDLGLNARVAAFAGAIALLLAALFTVTPALHLSLGRMRADLAEGSRGSAGTAWRRLGAKLVVVEIATATVLLAGAGLLGKSLYQLLRVEIGLQPEHLVTVNVAAPDATYEKDIQSIALMRQVLGKVETLPGVRSAGVARMGLPMDGNGNTIWFRVVGRPWHGEHYEVPQRTVSPNYFTTLGARLARGRYFTEAEDKSRPMVVIVNQAFTRKFFPGEDALGKQLVFLGPNDKPMEIVGIVDDIKEGPLDVATPPFLYMPFLQNPSDEFGLVVRTTQAEAPMIPVLAAAIRQIDPAIVSYRGATMAERIHDSPSAYLHRSSAWLVGGFAVLALVLGVVGLYGVIAYSVSRRTREIGVRMALGAQPGGVYRMILREAARLTGTGLAIGIACSIGAATLMQKLLFQVSSWDAATLAAVVAVLGCAALAAGFLPARRAAMVNPIDALRAE